MHNVTNLTKIKFLKLQSNNLSSIDLSQNLELINLNLSYNSLSNETFQNNDSLKYLSINGNQYSSIDLKDKPNLETLDCVINPNLVNLDLRNNNNHKITHIGANYNSNLTCISVDNVAYSTANWTGSNYGFDAHMNFSDDCANFNNATTWTGAVNTDWNNPETGRLEYQIVQTIL